MDPVTLQTLVTLGSFLVLGTVYIVNGKLTSRALATRLDIIDQSNDRRFADIENELKDFKGEMKRLSDVLIKLTEQEGRMNLLDDRMLAQGKRLDSMSQTIKDVLFKQGNVLTTGGA